MSESSTPLVMVKLGVADIRDGDTLLFRRPKSFIARLGRGDHSHAGRAAWWADDLMLLDTCQFQGARAVTLRSQVEAYPARWDVYRPNPGNRWPEYDRMGAVQYMRRLCGIPYGWEGVIIASLRHLPFVRLCVSANTDDRAIDRRPPFCSQAVALADRIGGGVDPVPNLADRVTEPCDLARSPFYRYKCTLEI